MEEDIDEQQDIQDDMWTPTPVQQVIDEMEEDVRIVVKLFYVPHSVASLKTKPDSTFDLLETVIGFGSSEYPVVARREAAHKAKDILAGLDGEVLMINHVQYHHYKRMAQVETHD